MIIRPTVGPPRLFWFIIATMNTAVAEVDLRPAAPTNALLDGFSRLDSRRKIGLIGGALALLAVLMVAFYMNRQADWKVLYAAVNPRKNRKIPINTAGWCAKNTTPPRKAR